MNPEKNYVTPEAALAKIYGKTSLELGMSEKRRDEIIAAAIFISFRNHEFGTRFHLPANYRDSDITEDARGIDVVVREPGGRVKQLQIKGIHIQRSIERRKGHKTKGVARILGRRTQRWIRRDSEELTRVMKGELKKIVQDYSGIYLIIYVSADFATQTSLEVAIRKNRSLVSGLKAREVWFLRNIPIVDSHADKNAPINCHAYKLIKVSPDAHTYGFCFSV